MNVDLKPAPAARQGCVLGIRRRNPAATVPSRRHNGVSFDVPGGGIRYPGGGEADGGSAGSADSALIKAVFPTRRYHLRNPAEAS